MNAATEELKNLRDHYGDWLLTLLTALLILMMFVFAPLQAAGYFVFEGLAVAGLLAIIGGTLIISANPIALTLMAIAFVANVCVFFWRLFQPPWPQDLYLVAGGWLVVSLTLGTVIAGAVFRRGVITYHRIIGAILLYLLIALTFATLFAFVGLTLPSSFKGITFAEEPTLVNSITYLSFVTLTSTGYGDIVPVHPLARCLCNLEAVIGQLFPATLLARLVTLQDRERRT
jgi:hypothetical protein